MLACSAAGGGLRIAVVGNEELVTAEAGRRVALSSGGRVVASSAGVARRPTSVGARCRADARPTWCCWSAAPTAATPRSLRRRRARLAAAGWPGPVVVAGNVDARDEVGRAPGAAGAPYVARRQRRAADRRARTRTAPGPRSGRCSCAHVIGGKHLVASADFRRWSAGATPDVVLDRCRAARPRARRGPPGAGDVAVVDVGGATTDVHSRGRRSTPRTPGSRREVVADPGDPHRRGRPRHALARGLDGRGRPGSRRRCAAPAQPTPRPSPGYLPDGRRRGRRRRGDRAGRGRSRAAPARRAPRVVVARRAGCVERTGKDLREVDLLVGSGGVLRNGRPGVAERVLAGSVGATSRAAGSCRGRRAWWSTTTTSLCAVGLLAGPHPDAAYRLARSGCPAGSLATWTTTEPEPGVSERRAPGGAAARCRSAPRAPTSGSPSAFAQQWARPRRAPRPSRRRSRPGPANLARAQVPVRRRPGRRVGLAVPRHRRGRLPRRSWLLAFFAVIRSRSRSRCSSPRSSVAAGRPPGPARRAARARRRGSSCSAASPSVALLLTFVGRRSPRRHRPRRPGRRGHRARSGTGCKTGPLNASDSQINDVLERAPGRDHRSTGEGGVVDRTAEVGTAVGHVVAGFFIVLFSTYFFLADGTGSGPGWCGSSRGRPAAGRQLGRVAWRSLTQFVRATVLVAAVDAIGIMIVAAVLGVPFVLAIGVLVFLGAFVPMIGATVAGSSRSWSRWSTRADHRADDARRRGRWCSSSRAHVLQPFLMGRFVSVHPLGVILAIGCGVLVAGIVGRPGRRTARRRAQRRRPAPRRATPRWARTIRRRSSTRTRRARADAPSGGDRR